MFRAYPKQHYMFLRVYANSSYMDNRATHQIMVMVAMEG